jgi:diguanylate cyclase (GGDEF)-like protein
VAEALESAFSSLDRGETAIAARLVAESGSRLDPRLCAIAIERLPRLTEAWKGSRVRRASDPARLLEEARVRQKTLRAERLKAVARRVDLLLAGASTLDEHLLVLVREEIAALVPLRHLALYALDGETAGPRVMLSTGLGDAAVRAVHEASSDSTVHVAGARVSTLPDGGVHLLLLADPDTDAEILDWLSETLARLLNGPLSGVHAPDSNLRASRTDPLTGLADAVALREALDGTLESAAVDHAPLTLVLVDMEGLPRLNTRHGRSVGDQALRALARVLVSTLRVKDLSARLGGAHFAALLEGCDALDAANVAARLREAVRGTTIILPDGFLESLEVRLGTASWPADGEGADELVERARERVLDEVEPLEESSLEQVA